MKRNMLSRWIMVLLITLLSACANNAGPVVIRNSGNTEVHVVSPSEDAVSKKAPVDAFELSRPNVQPVEPDKRALSSASPLKKKLMAQSEKKLQEDKPRAAIVLAERGLRVDRKEPRFYQVLAAAYHALANKAQSVYFAQQGLRYANKGSEIYRSLTQLSR